MNEVNISTHPHQGNSYVKNSKLLIVFFLSVFLIYILKLKDFFLNLHFLEQSRKRNSNRLFRFL